LFQTVVNFATTLSPPDDYKTIYADLVLCLQKSGIGTVVGGVNSHGFPTFFELDFHLVPVISNAKEVGAPRRLQQHYRPQ